MRLWSARRMFCGTLLAALLMLTLLVAKHADLVLPFTFTTTISSSYPLHTEDAPYPMPPQGDVPPYPDSEFRQAASSGGSEGEREGASSPPGQSLAGKGRPERPSVNASRLGFSLRQEEAPLKEAEELWSLIMAPKQIVKNDQKKTSSACVPKHHIFFGKVHKTGSSTIANILQRYGFTRDLNFVLPRKRLSTPGYNYLTQPGQLPSRARLIPPPIGQHYDIVWNHAIYHSDFYHAIMPSDTVFVSILRHPLEHFQSAFEYFGRMSGIFLNTILRMNVSNPLSVYLHNPAKYDKSKTSYVRNKQAQDLGMRVQHVQNATLRRQYLHQLDQEFHLVMITEFFDESLVLLRRLMCWDVKDILYIPKNKNNFKKKRVFTAQDLRRHRELNVADFDLYEFFVNRFNQTQHLQGSDFSAEVRAFKQWLQRVQKHCGGQSGNGRPLSIPATPWNAAFTVDKYDCELMQKSELRFLNDLMLDAVRKYQESAVQNRHS